MLFSVVSGQRRWLSKASRVLPVANASLLPAPNALVKELDKTVSPVMVGSCHEVKGVDDEQGTR
jgi:hypothetical protein